MSINLHDDYDKLAKLLYPSIEASGNVYYGQTKKLTIDEVLDKNNLNFDSHIETFKDGDEYKSYFCWKIGPLKNSIRVLPIEDGDDSYEYHLTGLYNFPDDNYATKILPDGSTEIISKNDSEDSEYIRLECVFAKYSLTFNSTPKENLTSAGEFKTYERIPEIEYAGLYATDGYSPIDVSVPTTDRSFYIKQITDNMCDLYIQIIYTTPYTEEELSTPLSFKSLSTCSIQLNIPTHIIIDESNPGVANAVLCGEYSYRINNGNWVPYHEEVILLEPGNTCSFICRNYILQTASTHVYFSISGNGVEAFGNINSMLSDHFESLYDISNYAFAFYGLFSNCTSLIKAPILPATVLSRSCYEQMFYGCASLIKAPELPATTLSSYCYEHMLSGCTSLTKAPKLPATILASSCYYYMFSGCTSLVKASELPATTLSNYCYFYMFSGCTSLTRAPELPAITISSNCYNNMFRGCTSLTKAPELPATALTAGCYRRMFGGCTSLIKAPKLPATTLSNGCYLDMFSGCTSLNEVYFKALLDSSTYTSYTDSWLSDVASSGTAYVSDTSHDYPRDDSGIPLDWSLADYDSLVESESESEEESEYEEDTYSYEDYNIGFNVRRDLPIYNKYKSGILVTSGSDSYDNGRGFFKEPRSKFHMLQSNPFSDSFSEEDAYKPIPDKYNEKNGSLAQEIWGYKCFNSPVAFRNGIYGEYGRLTTTEFYIPTKGFEDSIPGYIHGISSNYTNMSEINISANVINLSANAIHGLPSLSKTGNNVNIPVGSTCAIALEKLDESSASLFLWKPLTIVNLDSSTITITIKRSTTSAFGSDYEYSRNYDPGYAGVDFNNELTFDISLVTGGVLHIRSKVDNNSSSHSHTNYITITSSGNIRVEGNVRSLVFKNYTSNEEYSAGSSYIYFELFSECNIADASDLVLPDKTLNDDCYSYMFYGCTSLIKAPELPATTLADSCYEGMFGGCTSLTKAPKLPATVLTGSCYYSMFSGCTSLTKAPELPATTLSNNCYNNMFSGCTSLTKASELPATTLATRCYDSMFDGCTSLTKAPILMASGNNIDSYYQMFANCPNINRIYCCASISSNSNTGINDIVNHPTLLYVNEDNFAYVTTNPNINLVKISDDYSIPNEKPEPLTFENIGCAPAEVCVDGISLFESIEYFDEKDSIWKNLLPVSDEEPDTSDNIQFKHIIKFRGVAPSSNFTSGRSSYLHFEISSVTTSDGEYSSLIKLSGDINSILDYNNKIDDLSDYNSCFKGVFSWNGSIVDASDLLLPAITLSDSCYESMFEKCSLVNPPILPATVLKDYCYKDMFYGCASLTKAPELPATTLTTGCYRSMFSECVSLKTTPFLRFDHINTNNCSSMFYGCTSINVIYSCVMSGGATDIVNPAGEQHITFVVPYNSTMETSNNNVIISKTFYPNKVFSANTYLACGEEVSSGYIICEGKAYDSVYKPWNDTYKIGNIYLCNYNASSDSEIQLGNSVSPGYVFKTLSTGIVHEDSKYMTVLATRIK